MKNIAEVVSIAFDALGTEIELRIVVDDSAKVNFARRDLERARDMYEYFTKIFSRFDLSSELSTLNSQLGTSKITSIEMIEVASHCLQFNNDTNGIFDPRIIDTLESVGYKTDFKSGKFAFSENTAKTDNTNLLRDDLKIIGREIVFESRMDFSGVVKGYITDKISHFLKDNGWMNFLIDSGGDIFLNGLDQEGDVWRIDVEGIPHGKMMLALSGKGLATSGISKRKWEIAGKKFHHLINPKNPANFLFDLKTVTVISETTEDADVWAKTLFLMRKEDAILYAREHGKAAIVLDYKGSAWISPKAKEYLHK